MTEKSAYAPGEAIWADLSSPDPEASAAFYGSLLGWTAEPGQEEFGGYASFVLGDRKVAGLMPLMAPGQPPTWTCYFCTDDAEKTARAVAEAGGSTLAPPMTVADLGSMAVFADPVGAVFGVWQPGTHRGSELVDEDGSMTWFELTTPDPAVATPFYEKVLGLSTRTSPEYVELQRGDVSVAGVTPPLPDVAADALSGWIPYFVVADPQAAAQQAAELGGTVLLPLAEWGGGSCSIVQDPHGAVLGLLHATR